MTVTDTGLDPRTTYTYAIFAITATGTSAPIRVTATTRDPEPPPAVTDLAATSNATGGVRLSWRNPDADFTSLVVRRSATLAAPSTPSSGAGVAVPAGRPTSLIDTTALPSRLYTYAVFTVDADGDHNRATVLAVTPSATPSATAPTAPVALDRYPDKLVVGWTNPTDPTLEEVVVRRAVGSRAPVTITEGQAVPLGSPTASYAIDSGLDERTTYAYAVFAKTASGLSAPLRFTTSTKDSVPPGKVTSLTAGTATETGISLSWTKPADTDYAGVIVRRTDGDVPASSTTDGVAVGGTNKGITLTEDGLTPGTRYTYALFSADSSNNIQAPAAITVQTLGPSDVAPEFTPVPAYDPATPYPGSTRFNAVAVYDPVAHIVDLHSFRPGPRRTADQHWLSPDPLRVRPGLAPGIYEVSWRQDGLNNRAVLIRSSDPAAPRSNVAVLVPDLTWQAYNATGGANLYTRAPDGGVSMYRPLTTTDQHTNPSYSPIEFLRKTHGPVDVIALSALEEHAYDLSKYRTVVLYSHDEYWTVKTRNSVENAVKRGTNLLNMSGNTAWFVTTAEDGMLDRLVWWPTTHRPEDRLIGASFAYAGYDVQNSKATAATARQELLKLGFPSDVPAEKVFDQTRGARVLNAADTLFAGTGLRNGDWFGVATRAMYRETDGFPITPTGQPDLAKSNGFQPDGFQPLAEAWNWRNDYRHTAPVLRHQLGEGTVITLGSIGWIGALLADDPAVVQITKNAIGELAVDQPPAATVNPGAPAAPSFVSITPWAYADKATVTLKRGAANASPITRVEWSADGGDTWTSAGGNYTVFYALMRNGAPTSLMFRYVNAHGGGEPLGPVRVPARPTKVSLTPGDARILVRADLPDSFLIRDVEYSLNGVDWKPTGQTGGEFTVTGLTNSQRTSVQVRVIPKGLGAGWASAPVSAIPRTAPAAPTLTTIGQASATNPGMFLRSVFGSTNGAPITRVEYTLDGGTTWNPAPVLSSAFTLPDIPRNTRITAAIRTVNEAGTSPPSNPLTLLPAPTTTNITPARTGAHVTVAGPADTHHYAYSLDAGRTWKLTLDAFPTFTVDGLAPGTTSTLMVKAVPPAGDGWSGPRQAFTTLP